MREVLTKRARSSLVAALVVVAIAVERFAPEGDRAARAIGAVAIATGLFLLAQPMRK